LSGVFRKQIMKNRGSYLLGVFFLSLGLIGLFASIIMTYLDSVGYWGFPKDFSSAFFADRTLEQIGLGLQGLQLFHYFIGGSVVSCLGGTLLAAKKGIIHLVEEVTVTLKCKNCHGEWEETMSKAGLQSMNYPEVKSISRRKCPRCAKFIRPRIVNVSYS